MAQPLTLREIKHPGSSGPNEPIEFDPPTNRTLTLNLAYPDLTGTFVYMTADGVTSWTGTFALEDGEMTTWVDLTFETGGEMKSGGNCTGRTINTMIDTNCEWFQTIEDPPANGGE